VRTSDMMICYHDQVKLSYVWRMGSMRTKSSSVSR